MMDGRMINGRYIKIMILETCCRIVLVYRNLTGQEVEQITKYQPTTNIPVVLLMQIETGFS